MVGVEVHDCPYSCSCVQGSCVAYCRRKMVDLIIILRSKSVVENKIFYKMFFYDNFDFSYRL